MSDPQKNNNAIDRELKKPSGYIWNYWNNHDNKIYYITWLLSIVYSIFFVYPIVRLWVEGIIDNVTFFFIAILIFIVIPVIFAISPKIYYLFSSSK